jgi:hypothetical protein
MAEGVVIPEDAEVRAFKTALKTLTAEGISAKSMMHGVKLMEHYLEEALRIYASFQCPPELRLAEKALARIRKQDKGVFTLVDLYQRAVHAIDNAAKARTICNILADHGYIMRMDGGAISKFDKEHRREAFRLITPEHRK